MDIKITLDSKQLYPAVVNLKQFSSGTDVLTFLMEDYMYNTTDLSKMDCYAVCDMVNQEVDEVKLKTELVEGKLKITWTVDGYTTQLDGHITYQIVFKDIANEKAVLWFSHQGIIFISESHDGDGHIAAKYPTILQQWEQRMDDTDANASNILKQAQSGANTATQKANEASQSAKKAESEATDAKNSADKSEKMKDYIEELLNYEGTNAIEKEVVAARGEYPSLGNRIDNNENRLDTIEEQGVSVADTLPIGAQVMWDDAKPLPDNWEYADDDISDNMQLLINNDFQVNLREKSEYAKEEYTLPMWFLLPFSGASGGTDGKLTVLQNGIKLENTDCQSVVFSQLIDDSMRGKEVTIIGKFKEATGNINFAIFESTSVGGSSVQYGTKNINKDDIFVSTVTLPEKTTHKYLKVGVTMSSGSSCEIEYIDMFPGKIAYQHQKEDYATALMRCKDFYRKEWFMGVLTHDYNDPKGAYLFEIALPEMAKKDIVVNVLTAYYYNTDDGSQNTKVDVLAKEFRKYGGGTNEILWVKLGNKVKTPTAKGANILLELSVEPL